MLPLRLKLSKRQKLTLYFKHEPVRKQTMDLIMSAQGYENQLDQYNIIEYLGSTTMKAVHKVTGATVVVKVISDYKNNEHQNSNK